MIDGSKSRNEEVSQSGPTRRRLLQFLGGGLGALGVAGATGLTWLSVENGVFAAGDGPAYTPWAELRSGPPGPLRLVRAAVLAANAHNTQPWIFVVAADRIDLYADHSRTIGTMDPLLRELHISLGCAVENMVVAAGPVGLRPTITLLPDANDPNHVASVTLDTVSSLSSTLNDAIARRHTNRAPFDLDQGLPDGLQARYSDAMSTDEVELVWLDRDTFADLTVQATRAIIADPEQSADDFRWYRTTRDEIQQHRDGITIDASGQPRPVQALAKLLPVTRQQSNDGWLRGTRTQVTSAAAFGALVIRDHHDAKQLLAAGRAWQQLHLTATVDGHGLQPLCQVPERTDREETAGLAPQFTSAMASLIPSGRRAVMTFRIGRPTTTAPASPRRPINDVVRGGTR